jgi:hypothetical protein
LRATGAGSSKAEAADPYTQLRGGLHPTKFAITFETSVSTVVRDISEPINIYIESINKSFKDHVRERYLYNMETVEKEERPSVPSFGHSIEVASVCVELFGKVLEKIDGLSNNDKNDLKNQQARLKIWLSYHERSPNHLRHADFEEKYDTMIHSLLTRLLSTKLWAQLGRDTEDIQDDGSTESNLNSFLPFIEDIISRLYRYST